MLQVYVQEMVPDTDELLEEVLFKELQSDVLTGREAVLCISPIIEQPGWKTLDKISADSRQMNSMSITSSRVDTRSDKVAILSNGKNTLFLLDWEVQSTIVTHDPVIRVVGPDAVEIAEVICSNMLMKLMPKLFDINESVAKDVHGLLNITRKELQPIVDDVHATTEQLINDFLRLNK